MKLWSFLPSALVHRLIPCLFYFRKFLFPEKNLKWKPFVWKNLSFKNPLGTAGGLDKSARLIQGWQTYGPGFLEIGTITPKKQKIHPGAVLKKNISNQALWNYMGFPNSGADSAVEQLKKLKTPYPSPVFASIGKNRSTPLPQAENDYIFLIKKLYKYASAFVINISSPNTEKLRDLFKPDFLNKFLTSILKTRSQLNPPPHILLKLSPDLTDSEFLKAVEISSRRGIDGWVVCNSTLDRSFLKKKLQTFPSYGGVSGRPLAHRSKHLLKLLIQKINPNKNSKLIVSSGGVLTPEDVLERLELGADLVQVYSALVFHGPSFFEKTSCFFHTKHSIKN